MTSSEPSPLQQTPAASVHRLFEAQAARTPEVCAVTCGKGGLTYGELNCRANQLARHLQSVGVGPGTLAALCLDRSIEAIMGILAILKTGAAYVPLDPAYPAERLAYMLENSGARVLVTNAALWEQGPKVKTPAGLKMVYLQGHGAMDCYEATNLPGKEETAAAEASDDPLAYVIYTSGSTGQPKGVEMPHRPLVNLLRWQARTCPLAVGARVLQFAPLSFDVSFQEIFSTLGEGGTLALITEELRRDPRGLLRFLAESDIARAFLPPVMLHQLAEQQVNSDFAPVSLREIITAGEALRITRAVARFFSGLNGRCALHNHYGPTETHVVTAYTLAGAPEFWPELPPIGQPIDGVDIQLLNEGGEPVPEGQPGELFLGGECLARGYLGTEELTRSRFVEDAAGSRWYRTGDLVKLLPDGNLQFLGRSDDQVKIRGFRIELGEVEAALSHHPGVEATAAGVFSGAAGSQELIGYFIPRASQPTPNQAELRRWLSERLPHYMLPTHFVALAKLPLTPSGKVDRRALPRYEAPAAKPGENPPAAPPQTSLEKVIARLWEESLSIRNPGLRDNFFEIGGNSIHAVQVHTRLCQTLQREFPITAIFQHPTIAALAKFLHPPADEPSRLTPMQERARRQQQAAAAAAASRGKFVRNR